MLLYVTGAIEKVILLQIAFIIANLTEILFRTVPIPIFQDHPFLTIGLILISNNDNLIDIRFRLTLKICEIQLRETLVDLANRGVREGR